MSGTPIDCDACECGVHTCRPDTCHKCGKETHDGLSYGRCFSCTVRLAARAEDAVRRCEALERERDEARADLAEIARLVKKVAELELSHGRFDRLMHMRPSEAIAKIFSGRPGHERNE